MSQILLPLKFDIETKNVMKKTAKAHQALAELKGVVSIMPNETILINTLSLQEAKDSSEIENIITTHDDLYKSDRNLEHYATVAAKEVHHYAKGLLYGFDEVKRSGLLTQKTILTVQEHIEQNRAGYRKLPGTALKNDRTGETVYTPPQSYDEIVKLMDNLEKFINDNGMSDCDPLVKMAVIHHQFESIHPFYDGNGRSGRIINILYLVKEKLLNLPVLYLSRYINSNRAEYYRLLQSTRDSGDWEEWILFILDGIETTAGQTTVLIHAIKAMMQTQKETIRSNLPKIYSQDLLNNIFRHPYTKIEFLVQELSVHRNTAAKYLDELTSIGILTKHKISKENYYLNNELFNLFLSVGENGGAKK